jgi:putative oxygen-independent coproporphyrinogen III oxidase
MQFPPLGLYIHLPWCERKCPYCDFNSHQAGDIPEEAYVQALLSDLDQDLPLVRDRVVETLFIGGGTPSLFTPESIHRLLDGIAARLELAPDLEATMEANPGSSEAARFRGYREAGINRLSLGIQSFDDDCLTALGRVHDSGQARAAIAMARRAGFDNFNVDLMHGLPGQQLDAALADLRETAGFEPPHLSWYQLTIEPNTKFYSRPPALPPEELLGDIQDAGESRLDAAGYRQYEVSAYARPGLECRHNLNYWTFGDYLGIGAGAHGKISAPDGHIRRYHKTRVPEAYLSATVGSYTSGTRLLSPEDVAGEFMMNALRLSDGFTPELFESRTGLRFAVVESRVAGLVDRDLLACDTLGIRATATGRRFLDSVIAEFFPG